MNNILITIITLYQRTISPDSGYFRGKRHACVFYPTCSQYTIEAIEKYGSMKGAALGLRRILRCHPWQKNRIDPLT